MSLLLAACNRQQVVPGECGKVSGADVCTWGEMSGNTLVAFGATVPIASIGNAAADAPMVWPPVVATVIPLPDAVQSGTGFRVLRVYWEAHGHPPGPFLVPHFDFHFYVVPPADVVAIDCADSLKPSALAAGYGLPDVTIPQIGTLRGLCVPQMGMHSLPETELRATQPFQKTMVVGYYHGQNIFVEPMVTRAILLERRSFTLDVPVVPGQPANTRYPTRFRADYDSTAQAYRFVFSEFTGSRAP